MDNFAEEDKKTREEFHESSMKWISMDGSRESTFYRLFKMGNLVWTSYIVGDDRYGEFDIESSLIACGQNGGPIAVVKRKGHFVYGGKNKLKDYLMLFNASGEGKGKLVVT